MNDRGMVDVSEQRRSNLYYALIGFGAGAIVGATMALLYAPQSGKDTRDAIKDKIGDVSDRAGDVYSSARDAVSGAYSRAGAAIGRAKEKLTSKAVEPEEV